ncbi:MAG TPA: hypothetical protein VJ871_06875 [Bacteroidales bacterium]|jgi:hypothetical protein|nr:hypothetical protein [Bacteroidales bacterium]
MTEFTSEVQTIHYSAERVFERLSDLNQLDQLKASLPADKVSNFSCDRDSCQFNVSPVGQISVRVIEREPFKTIKLTSEKSPISFTAWVQLKALAPDDTRLKLTMRADIPFMLKGMVQKPLQEGIQKAAEFLAGISY